MVLSPHYAPGKDLKRQLEPEVPWDDNIVLKEQAMLEDKWKSLVPGVTTGVRVTSAADLNSEKDPLKAQVSQIMEMMILLTTWVLPPQLSLQQLPCWEVDGYCNLLQLQETSGGAK